MLLRKISLSVLMILILLTPSFALAEGDFEQGDGWVYQDGELTITDNQGLANFLYYVEVSSDANMKYSVSDVDHVIIGKDITDIVINDYIYNYNPSNTSVEEGNKSYIIDNGWVVNKSTNTLFGAANVKQNKTRSEIDNLPTYIEHIGMYAFNDCSELKEITIPEGVVSIGESCFSNCNSLESIVLPSSVTSIGAIAFHHCTSLNDVSFGANVKEIGAAAFNACIHLETPPFYNMKLDTIYGNSFWGCDAFQTAEFPSTLRVVENQAFAHSKELTSLIFNSDQLIIENGAFDACENIRKLIFTKGAPLSIGRYLFHEDEKTPDGKSFITRLYDPNGKIIPYPTLYYTAAYADEWAPNGETEWNGYSIQQISKEELNAILTEVRGEPIPAAAPAVEPVVDAPVTPQKATMSEIAEMICHAILLLEMAEFAVAITILIALKMKNRQRKNNAPKENSYVSSANTDGMYCVPNATKRLSVQSKHIVAIKKLICWLAGILFALFVFLVLCFLAMWMSSRRNDVTEHKDIPCSASVAEYVDPVTAREYLDITVVAPEGSIVRLIANVVLTKDQVTVDAANSVRLRISQNLLLPWTPLESNTILITPKIEVTLPTGEVVRPSLPIMFEKVPVLEVFLTDPTEEVIEIPEDQQTIRIAGYVNYSNDIPVYVNNEQVYVDDAGNFESEIDLTQLDGDSSNSGNNGLCSDAEKTITIEARLDNCKTARKTITIHRIPTKRAGEAELSGSISEQGNGWKYQNGVLTITANGGFEAYFKEVDDYDRAEKYQNEPYQVDCVVIGKNVTQFSMFAFGTDFYPTQMVVEEGNPYFSIVDGWLVNKKTNTLICATDLDHFQWMPSVRNMPDSVQYIGENAFYPLNNIQQICLPDKIIAIGDNAFESCEALQTIELPSNVKEIGRSAFDYCHSMKNVSLDSSVDTIGEYAFYSCYNLETINLEDTQITELNSNVLSMAGIKSIILPDTLQTIKSNAFELCWFLETITVCSDNIVIYDGAFSKCDALKSIVFTKGVPKWMGSCLFDETGKTADGKSFISSSYDAEGKVIPYPTLLYTAAYAGEWAPNGETEWNGYSIQQISKEELDAIITEARGEPVPTPTATVAPVATASPAATQEVTTAASHTPFIVLLLAGLIALAVAAIVVVGVRLKKRKDGK